MDPLVVGIFSQGALDMVEARLLQIGVRHVEEDE